MCLARMYQAMEDEESFEHHKQASLQGCHWPRDTDDQFWKVRLQSLQVMQAKKNVTKSPNSILEVSSPTNVIASSMLPVQDTLRMLSRQFSNVRDRGVDASRHFPSDPRADAFCFIFCGFMRPNKCRCGHWSTKELSAACLS